MTRTPEPPKNCHGCAHDMADGCCALTPMHDRPDVFAWLNTYDLDENEMPPADADGCPGFAPRTPVTSDGGEKGERGEGEALAHATAIVDRQIEHLSHRTRQLVRDDIAATFGPLLDSSRSRLAHLERALMAERGEGEPRPGWERNDMERDAISWWRGIASPDQTLWAHRRDWGWVWEVDVCGETVEQGRVPSALEAIDAAELALAALSGLAREGE